MTQTLDLTGDGGVLKTILKESKFNELPKEGHEVEVHYTGKLESGAVFDSSYKRGTTFKFILGEGNVIKGWEIGLAATKIGETVLLVIKPEYAYGSAGAGTSVPPDSTLYFEIELINSRVKPKNKWEMTTEEMIQAASDAKADGNAKFMSGQIIAAITYYDDGVRYLSMRDGWTDKERSISDITKLQCHLNLANCYIKTEDFASAETNASEALLLDPNNIKGLYRRGIARIELGYLREAVDDLTRLVKLEPTNAQGILKLKIAQDKYKLAKQRERKTFSTVFKKMDLYTEKAAVRNLQALPRVYMDIEVNDTTYHLVIGLFEDSVPKTVENFKHLCNKDNKINYKGNKFHRLIKGFMIQGGDVTHGDGTGGTSIYGDQFDDENFVDVHDDRGILSMANCGPNTNNSQFFITFAPTPHLDGKHVVFGKIIEGMKLLDVVEELETASNNRPIVDVTIADVGLL